MCGLQLAEKKLCAFTRQSGKTAWLLLEFFQSRKTPTLRRNRLSKNLPPKKNLSCLRQITRRVKIVSGVAHFDFAQYEPPPFRIFAGEFPRRLRRRNAFGLIQEYCTMTNPIPFWYRVLTWSRELKAGMFSSAVVSLLCRTCNSQTW